MYIDNLLNLSLDSKYYRAIMTPVRYTLKQFKEQFPDGDACLQAVFDNRFGNLQCCPKCGVVGAKFYRVRKRPCYACAHCGHQLHPLANTIFRKSSTSLWSWFYVIYLFSISKNGVSAKEVERAIGCTYKTAWRMCRQIRLLMTQDQEQLTGIVEADETYIGGRRRQSQAYDNKTPVVGIVEKRGRMKAITLNRKAGDHNVMPFLIKNIRPLSVLHTDKSAIYRNAYKDGFKHRSVDHGVGHYVENGISTNCIESFWSQLKRSINGTFHSVSPKYLQQYVNQFVFLYNHRAEAACPILLERAATLGRLDD